MQLPMIVTFIMIPGNGTESARSPERSSPNQGSLVILWKSYVLLQSLAFLIHNIDNDQFIVYKKLTTKKDIIRDYDSWVAGK
jgi:hypothetical protein